MWRNVVSVAMSNKIHFNFREQWVWQFFLIYCSAVRKCIYLTPGAVFVPSVIPVIIYNLIFR